MKNYYYCDKNSIITVKSRQIVFFYYVALARQVWNKNIIQITTYQFNENPKKQKSLTILTIIKEGLKPKSLQLWEKIFHPVLKDANHTFHKIITSWVVDNMTYIKDTVLSSKAFSKKIDRV